MGGKQDRHNVFPHGNRSGERSGREHWVHCIQRRRECAGTGRLSVQRGACGRVRAASSSAVPWSVIIAVVRSSSQSGGECGEAGSSMLVAMLILRDQSF